MNIKADKLKRNSVTHLQRLLICMYSHGYNNNLASFIINNNSWFYPDHESWNIKICTENIKTEIYNAQSTIKYKVYIKDIDNTYIYYLKENLNKDKVDTSLIEIYTDSSYIKRLGKIVNSNIKHTTIFSSDNKKHSEILITS